MWRCAFQPVAKSEGEEQLTGKWSIGANVLGLYVRSGFGPVPTEASGEKTVNAPQKVIWVECSINYFNRYCAKSLLGVRTCSTSESMYVHLNIPKTQNFVLQWLDGSFEIRL